MDEKEAARVEIVVNGLPIDATEPLLTATREGRDAGTFVSFKVGVGAPEPLYRIGAPVALRFGERGASLFRVVGLNFREGEPGQQPVYEVRLREVGPIEDYRETLDLLYGAVFETILNRVRNRGLLELLVEKGILTEEEFVDRCFAITDRNLVDYASSIVSKADAESMRAVVLGMRQPGSASAARDFPRRPG